MRERIGKREFSVAEAASVDARSVSLASVETEGFQRAKRFLG